MAGKEGIAVLTESDPFIYIDGAIATAAARTFPELVPKDKGGISYDLLSMPGLKYLPRNRRLLEQTVRDILDTLALHRSEQLLVVTAVHSHTPLVQRLKDDRRLRQRVRLIRGYTANARRTAPTLKTLAVPDMEWRKHGDGFMSRFVDAYGGGDSLGIMTVPGAVRDMKEGTERGQMLVDLFLPLARKGLQRVVLVSSTDRDLAAAAMFIRKTCDITVECGFAHASDYGISHIEPLTE